MKEIKIAKKSWISIAGLISAVAMIGIGMFFWSLANEPHIKSALGIQLIASFLIGVGLFTLVFIIREYNNPKYLVLNEQGIDNQTSFGFVAWEQILGVSRFEGTIGTGRHQVWAEGVLIEVNESYEIPGNLNMFKRRAVGYAAKKWGSPTVIYGSNWTWNQFEIEEKIQSYLTAHRNKSKGRK